MRLWTLAIAAVTLSLAAACGDEPPQPRVGNAPDTASAGAGSSVPTTGQREALPANPKATAGDTKPDPGDANDHSTPQHDAKKKSSGD